MEKLRKINYHIINLCETRASTETHKNGKIMVKCTYPQVKTSHIAGVIFILNVVITNNLPYFENNKLKIKGRNKTQLTVQYCVPHNSHYNNETEYFYKKL